MPSASAAALMLPCVRCSVAAMYSLLQLLEREAGRQAETAARRAGGGRRKAKSSAVRTPALAGHEGPLDGVLQLADVARPVVVHQERAAPRRRCR